VYVNGGAQVIAADVLASNGVVHVIDQVLMPPSLRNSATNSYSSVDVRRELNDAIAEGGPMYNRGDERGCYERYLSSANKVLSVLTNSNSRSQLSTAISQGKRSAMRDDYPAAAWSLRYAFDDILASL
jgi:predicted GTPase